jgi:hypothetical protein
MASPFSIFRKNQKVMLAGITILAMFAFVFVSPWGRGSNGPAAGAAGTPVATWKFGTIYRSDIDTRINSRRVVNLFIQSAYKQALSKGAFKDGGQPSGFPEDWRSVLDAIILHKKAEQLGLAVTDTAINEYINREVTENTLSGSDLDAALRAVGSGRVRYTPEQIFDALRFELEVRNFEELLLSDERGDITPEQWYDYYSRLHRNATIQVLPVEVKDFVAKVPDPSEGDLRAFFEKYKDDFSRPDSPAPGFKVPVKAKFQYFEAKIDDFIKPEKSKVTEEEIKKYYDEHKELFRKTDDETSSSKSTSDKTTGADKTDAGAGGKTPETGKESAKPETDKTPVTPEKSLSEKAAPEKSTPEKKSAESKDGGASSAKPAAGTAAPEKGATEKPAPDKTPSTKPPAEKPTDEKSSTPQGKSVEFRPSPRYRAINELLALADDAAPPPVKPADNNTAKPANDGVKPSDTKPADAKASDPKPAEGKPADNKATDTKATDNKSTDVKSPDAKPAVPSTESPAGKNAPEKSGSATTPTTPTGIPDLGLKPTEPPKKIPIVEYDSLDSEKVRDKIRTEVAREKAGKQIEDALKSLRSAVSSYQTNLSKWIARQEGSQPVQPDFAALAKAKGVQFEQTAWLSAQELYDTTELGKSIVFSSAGRETSVVAQAFHPQIPKFKPYDSYLRDPETEIIWWRTDYKDSYVPKFEEARKDVLATWKMIEARKLAKAQAKEYADQVKKQQAELQEVFKFSPEVHPSKDIGPFTWMTGPPFARNPEQPVFPHLTQLSGVDKAGEDFMRTVFSLNVGSTGVAMNQPETIAYVVQLKSLTPPEEAFRRQFLQSMGSRSNDSGLIAYAEAQQVAHAKIMSIDNEFDFKLLNTDLDATNGPAGRNSMPSDEGDD